MDEASVATIRVGRLTALTKIQKMVRKAISSCCHKDVLLSDMFDSVKTTFRTKLDFSEFHRFDICATCTLISLGHNRAKISVRTCAICKNLRNKRMFEKVNIAKNCFRLQILVLEKNAGMERFA